MVEEEDEEEEEEVWWKLRSDRQAEEFVRLIDGQVYEREQLKRPKNLNRGTGKAVALSGQVQKRSRGGVGFQGSLDDLNALGLIIPGGQTRR
ncbi:hypothetical protein AAFF_G00385170 [Aldrovandia affinis]|uniref:Uncharacterized protein n=1 Tax=Aldrovandia affinis TaxID=143900 RepID=A0AAD7SH10_9TELE|nr:hypothetical protein AAFF_G00385170 [Aldrovandia affinis]